MILCYTRRIKAVIDLNVIYIDVLIVLNIYVTYFLIKATSKITHSSLKTSGLVISSVIGSLFSLVILIPHISFMMMFLIKAAAAFIIVFIAFPRKRFSEYLRLVVYFYIINFIFAGIIMGLKYFIKPEYISVNNSFVYIDVSLMSLVLFTAAAYFIICGIRQLLDRGTQADGEYFVIIKNGGKMISLDGLADTGNSMTDVFTGKPVIVCSSSALSELVGIKGTDDMYEFLLNSENIKGARLIPYSTIDGTGMLPAFIPDEVIIKKDKTLRNVDVLIGIKECSAQAIFNPALLV